MLWCLAIKIKLWLCRYVLFTYLFIKLSLIFLFSYSLLIVHLFILPFVDCLTILQLFYVASRQILTVYRHLALDLYCFITIFNQIKFNRAKLQSPAILKLNSIYIGIQKVLIWDFLLNLFEHRTNSSWVFLY